jgi:hypothetical protein
VKLHEPFRHLVLLAHNDVQELSELLPDEDPNSSEVDVHPEDQLGIGVRVVTEHFRLAADNLELVQFLDRLGQAVGESIFLHIEVLWRLVFVQTFR